METPAPVRCSVGGWREGFQEHSCLTALPLSYLASKYSQMPCKYSISSWPDPMAAVTSCIPLVLDAPLLSRLPSPFSLLAKLLGMPVPGMTEKRWEHPVVGLRMGFEGAGNSGHGAFKGTCPTSGRRHNDPFSWKPVLDVEQSQHKGIFEQLIPTYNCLSTYRKIQVYMHVCT